MKTQKTITMPVRQTQVLLLIMANPEITSTALAAKLKITASNARNILSDMAAAGFIRRIPARWEVEASVAQERGDVKMLKAQPAGKRGRPAKKK